MSENDLMTAADDLTRIAYSLRKASENQAVNPNRLRRIAMDLQAVANKIEETADILIELAQRIDDGDDITDQSAYLRGLSEEL